MPTYRHVVRLPYASGLPADVAVNVFHSLGNNDGEATTFSGHLVTFYNAIDAILSGLLSNVASAATVTTYRVADAPPRAPVQILPFTLVTSVNTLPPEVAVTVSFQGLKVSGQPQARRRGRVFLGPMANINDLTTGRPTGANVTTIATAADALLTSSLTAGSAIWSVYSPTSGNTTIVNNGWVDNEFDTIRERGRPATSRTTFS